MNSHERHRMRDKLAILRSHREECEAMAYHKLRVAEIIGDPGSEVTNTLVMHSNRHMERFVLFGAKMRRLWQEELGGYVAHAGDSCPESCGGHIVSAAGGLKCSDCQWDVRSVVTPGSVIGSRCPSCEGSVIADAHDVVGAELRCDRCSWRE